MKNQKVSSNRPETSKEKILRSFSEDPGSVDIQKPLKPPLTIYDENPFTAGKDINVITIGKGVIFSGKVIKAESVILEGAADGEIFARTVEISAAGSLDGSVKCDALIVAGTFSGEAAVVAGLSVTSTGKIEGKISYGSLSVEEGGVVLGSLEQSNGANAPSSLNEKVSDTAAQTEHQKRK